MNARETHLRFEKADAFYPNGFQALHQVSLDVKAGEFVAVIGPSGAGKSSLLRTINGTIPAKGLHTEVLGLELSKIPKRELRMLRARIGFIFQQFNLVKNLSVLENVLHGRLAKTGLIRSLLGLHSREDLRLANEALGTVGLGDKTESRVDELSGGQQQRVAIARAFVQNPELILADEPMASLDPRLSEAVIDLLGKFNLERGATVIVNIHALELIRRHATRIIALREGRVIFDAPPAQLDEGTLKAIYERAGS